MTDTQKDLLLIGGLGILALYAFSKVSTLIKELECDLQKGAKAAEQALCKALVQPVKAATATVACAAANAYLETCCYYTCGVKGASGSVTLCCGSSIPLSSIPGGVSFCCGTQSGIFCYGGRQYAIAQGSGGGSGAYTATALNPCCT